MYQPDAAVSFPKHVADTLSLVEDEPNYEEYEQDLARRGIASGSDISKWMRDGTKTFKECLELSNARTQAIVEDTKAAREALFDENGHIRSTLFSA